MNMHRAAALAVTIEPLRVIEQKIRLAGARLVDWHARRWLWVCVKTIRDLEMRQDRFIRLLAHPGKRGAWITPVVHILIA